MTMFSAKKEMYIMARKFSTILFLNARNNVTDRTLPCRSAKFLLMSSYASVLAAVTCTSLMVITVNSLICMHILGQLIN